METLRDIEMKKIEGTSQIALTEFVDFLNRDENKIILKRWGIMPYSWETHSDINITLSYVNNYNSLFHCMAIRFGMLYDDMCSGNFVSDNEFFRNEFALPFGRIEMRYMQKGYHRVVFNRYPWMFIDMAIVGNNEYKCNIDGIISLYINNFGTWSREFVKYLNVNYGITMSNLLPILFHMVVD